MISTAYPLRTLALALLLIPRPAQDATVRDSATQFTVEIGPVDLRAGSDGHVHGEDPMHVHSNAVEPPVQTFRLPGNGYLNGFKLTLTDAAGKTVPGNVIHHLNFIDPDHRELFLPISQRMLAVGKETGAYTLPRALFGYPISKGQEVIVTAMLHNPHPRDFLGVTVRVTFTYSPPGRPWPLLRVHPFQLDVMFPYGDKAFDLPPGESERWYEASPAVPGRIVVISGHVHEHARSLRLTDVTTGELLWEGRPLVDASGTVKAMPVSVLRGGRGIRLRDNGRYRVTVVYDNPTRDTLRAGGMGVIGGLFLPGIGFRWPRADRRDSLYLLDRLHYLSGE